MRNKHKEEKETWINPKRNDRERDQHSMSKEECSEKMNGGNELTEDRCKERKPR